MSDESVMRRDGLYGLEFREFDQRRVPSDERHAPNIKQLWARSHEIVRLACRGFKQVEIASILNIHPQTVSNTLNSDLGKLKLSQLQSEADNETKIDIEKVNSLKRKALDTYHEIFDNENGEATLEMRRKTADQVIEKLSGLVKTPEQKGAFMILTPGDLADFKERSRQAAIESGYVVEAEAEEVKA